MTADRRPDLARRAATEAIAASALIFCVGGAAVGAAADQDIRGTTTGA